MTSTSCTSRAVLAVFIWCFAIQAIAASELDSQTSIPRPLSLTIELRDGQSGFAGVSGTIWRISADGNISISKFVNTKQLEGSRQGKIGAAEVAKLRERFVQARFETLPASMGVSATVNPRTLTLTYHGRTVRLSLPATEAQQPSLMPIDSEELRVIDLANNVRRIAEQATTSNESANKTHR